ncbi:hypothetical protein [Sphingobium sufflavum]|nr:hypothetical protein [Sphingobium sufflavum]
MLLILFGISIVGQLLTSWHVTLEDAQRHSRAAMGLGTYPKFTTSMIF